MTSIRVAPGDTAETLRARYSNDIGSNYLHYVFQGTDFATLAQKPGKQTVWVEWFHASGAEELPIEPNPHLFSRRSDHFSIQEFPESAAANWRKEFESFPNIHPVTRVIISLK
jgi:hypothetical protein